MLLVLKGSKLSGMTLIEKVWIAEKKLGSQACYKTHRVTANTKIVYKIFVNIYDKTGYKLPPPPTFLVIFSFNILTGSILGLKIN